MGNIVVTQPSASVGDYLKAVWETAGSGAASTKGVADRLSVSSASVTNMFARLQGMGLALYEPYRGGLPYEAGARGGFAAGTAAPPDRDAPTRASRVFVGGSTRGGRAAGARRLRRVHGAPGRASGPPGAHALARAQDPAGREQGSRRARLPAGSWARARACAPGEGGPRAGRRRHRRGRGRGLPRSRRTPCAFHPGQTPGVGDLGEGLRLLPGRPEDFCLSNCQLVALFLVADCHVWE